MSVESGVKSFINVLWGIIKFFLILITIVLFFVWISSLVGLFTGVYMAPYMISGSPVLAYLGAASAWALAAIPLFFILLFCIRLITRYKIPMNVWISGFVFWLVALCLTAFTGFRTKQDFNYSHTNKQEVINIEVPNNNLSIDFNNNARDIYEEINIGGFKVGPNHIFIGNQRIELHPSVSDSYQYEYIAKSKGKSLKQAQTNTQNLIQIDNTTPGTIKLDGFIALNRGRQFRDQRITHHFYIPEGGQFSIGNLEEYIDAVKLDDQYLNWRDVQNSTWTLKNGKFEKVNTQ